jgi:hypothetical protein
MGKIDNIEQRKQKNAPFCKAFDYIAELKEVSDKVLAERIGSKGPYISMYRAGKKPVPMEVMENLVLQSEGELNMEFLLGNSDYMLLRNVPDDEMVAIQMRKGNPDYDVMQERLKAKERQLDKDMAPAMPYIDPSSQQNASLSAYIQLTNRLDDDLKKKELEMQERLDEKKQIIESLNARIRDLERTVADKETIIKAREAHITNLERQLVSVATSDIEHYPFAIGAAEEKMTVNTLKI